MEGAVGPIACAALAAASVRVNPQDFALVVGGTVLALHLFYDDSYAPARDTAVSGRLALEMTPNPRHATEPAQGEEEAGAPSSPAEWVEPHAVHAALDEPAEPPPRRDGPPPRRSHASHVAPMKAPPTTLAL